MTRARSARDWVLAALTAAPVFFVLVTLDAAAFWAGARAFTWALVGHPVVPPLLCFAAASTRAWWRAALKMADPAAGSTLVERVWIGATHYGIMIGGCWFAAWVLR